MFGGPGAGLVHAAVPSVLLGVVGAMVCRKCICSLHHSSSCAVSLEAAELFPPSAAVKAKHSVMEVNFLQGFGTQQ